MNNLTQFLLIFLLVLNTITIATIFYLNDILLKVLNITVNNQSELDHNRNYLGNLSYGNYISQNKTPE
jgi:hypothetical protein